MSLQPEDFKGQGGIRLVADVGGPPDAPVVVLTHGGGQTRHSWHRAAQDFARLGYRVVSLDARGHGDSAWAADGDYSLSTLAADLRAVLAVLPGKPALVGASMGGLTSLVTVGEAGAPIAGALVLVDVVPKVERAGVAKIRNFMTANPEGFANLEEAVDAVAAYNPHRPRPKDATGLMRNLRRREDGRLHWHWDPAFMNQQTFIDPMLGEERLEQAARNIKIPTLLVRGGSSDVVSEAGVLALKESVPQAEFADIAGAGHMVAGDRNDIFNEAVESFLRKHLAPAPRSV